MSNTRHVLFLVASARESGIVGNTEWLARQAAQALPADTFLEADYRRYHDTWSINSNTLSVGLSKHVSPQVLLGAMASLRASAASLPAPTRPLDASGPTLLVPRH